MSEIMIAILTIIVISIVGVISLEIKGDQATCTTTRLSSTSFVVCTFKDQILYSGEIKNE